MTTTQADSLREASTILSPVWPQLPPARTFTPVVLLLALGFPLVMATFSADPSPAGSEWGLRAYKVLAGDVFLLSEPSRPVPPFFAWCTAAILRLPLGDPDDRLAICCFVFWVLTVFVLYPFVQRSHGEPMAQLVLIVLSMNPALLRSIQSGEPATSALFWSVLGITSYVEHSRVNSSRRFWSLATSGLAVGMLVLTVGITGLWLGLLIGIHAIYRFGSGKNSDSVSDDHPLSNGGPWEWLSASAITFVIVCLWLGLGLARSPDVAGPPLIPAPVSELSIGSLMLAMPATAVLAAFSIVVAVRRRLRQLDIDRQMVLPHLWAITSLLSFLFFERNSTGLVLAVAPLTILAARSLRLIVNRWVRDQVTLTIMLATLAVVVFTYAGRAVLPLFRDTWEKSSLGWFLLDFHLALDVLFLGGLVILLIYRSSSNGDTGRRVLFGGFAVLVVLGSFGISVLEMSRTSVERTATKEMYREWAKLPAPDWFALVGGPLRDARSAFTLHSLAPHCPFEVTTDLAELENRLDARPGIPIVAITNADVPSSESLSLTQGTSTLLFQPVAKSSTTPLFAVMKSSALNP